MSEYYAVQRSGEYLEHYGIKGMKWGVRKAIADGNGRALRRQYNKAVKKLAKLEKRGASGAKSAKKAAAYGAGAALAGGLAAAGTGGVGTAIRATGRLGRSAMNGIGNVMDTAGRVMSKRRGVIGKVGNAVGTAGRSIRRAGKNMNLTGAAQAVDEWGRRKDVGKPLLRAMRKPDYKPVDAIDGWTGKVLKAEDKYKNIREASNNTYARIGAGALAVGLGAAAARNAYKAATAKRSRQKAAQFKVEMQKAFAGTQYANGAPRQGKKRRRS